MIPIRDVNPSAKRPIVNTIIVLINIAVFIFQIMLPEEALETFYMTYAIVPLRLTQSLDAGAVFTLFSSMFMHGGFAHILSNMLYLWIFGDNVEDLMGHGLYLIFYLASGLAAGLAQVFVAPASEIPLLGASGAIAGILGAYLIFYPRARVQSLVLLGYFARMIELPALIVLGGWFVLQLFNGFLSFGMAQTGGVAWFAHIGGFVVGMVGALLCRALGCKPRDPQQMVYGYPDDRYRRRY